MRRKREVLFVLNDPAFGTERSYDALRLAGTLIKRDGVQIDVFLIGDAVGCAVGGQKTPEGYCKLETMIRSLARKGAAIGCCGACLDARGFTDEMLTEGSGRSSMEELADWTIAADKALAF